MAEMSYPQPHSLRRKLARLATEYPVSNIAQVDRTVERHHGRAKYEARNGNKGRENTASLPTEVLRIGRRKMRRQHGDS